MDTNDLDHLWPELIDIAPRARLGLSRGKPAVFNWHPYSTGFFPLVADEWTEAVQRAIKTVGEARRQRIEAALEE